MSNSSSSAQAPRPISPKGGNEPMRTGAADRSTSVARPETADGDALARAQAGDHQAFAQLYALHKRRIYSLCLRMVGNVAEAEDLTQEAFLQLHRKIANCGRRGCR
jgi:RNA polymerase sigma-70 factor (ECF subfamily)